MWSLINLFNISTCNLNYVSFKIMLTGMKFINKRIIRYPKLLFFSSYTRRNLHLSNFKYIINLMSNRDRYLANKKQFLNNINWFEVCYKFCKEKKIVWNFNSLKLNLQNILYSQLQYTHLKLYTLKVECKNSVHNIYFGKRSKRYSN